MTVRLNVDRLEDRLVPAAAADLPVLPEIDGPMQAHLRAVAARGRLLGNRADVFAKVGDSNTAFPEFVTALGGRRYDPAANGLADRPDLVATWAAYHATPAAGAADSFARASIGDDAGWSSADLRKNVAAEIAAVRPAIAVIMIGTNDAGSINDLPLFRDNLTRVVRNCLETGVIPVVSTIPDLLLSPLTVLSSANFNAVIREVVAELDVPLWNFHRQTTALPNFGLRGDNIHLSISPNGSGRLGGADLLYGANVRNRTVLEVLQKVRAVVLNGGRADGDAPPTATAWTPVRPGQRLLAAGSGAHRGAEVAVYDADTRKVLSRLVPYGPTFRGGVSVAVGDVDGDGVADVVTGAGPGGGPAVKVFSGTDGREVRSWFAYEPSFRGGVGVAVGDVTGDGAADVAVGSGRGGGPRVRVFDGRAGRPLADFFAFEPSFRGGVSVAIAADAAGPRVVVGAGPGGGPVVAAFDPLTGSRVFAAFAYAPTFRGGVTVAVGDATGDGRADVVVGSGPGGGPLVRVYDPAAGRWVRQFFAFDPAARAGVRVAVAGGAVFGGQVEKTGSKVRGEDGSELAPFGDFRGGVFVGG